MPRKARRRAWGSVTEAARGKKYVLRWVENTPQGRRRRSRTVYGTYREACAASWPKSKRPGATSAPCPRSASYTRRATCRGSNASTRPAKSNTRKPNERDGGLALQATLLFPFPGMAHDCHNNLPTCLLKSWTPEQLDYMHDIDWWRAIISQTEGVEIVDMHAMGCTTEAWADWLACDNPYAQGDRAAIAAGALGYLNTIAITLRKL